MSRGHRQTRRRTHRRRCRDMHKQARFAAAAMIAAAASVSLPSQARAAFAGPEWQEGSGIGTYDLIYGDVILDIDGDGITDITITGDCIGCGYGEAVLLSPSVVGEYNNQVITGYGILWFDTADEIYQAVDEGAATTSTSTETLWDTAAGMNDFETRGFAGVIFDIPGGSEYVAYIDLTVETNFGEFSQLVIHETGYTALGGGLAGDLNDDGFVGIEDLNIVLGVWNQNVPPADIRADPSGDGFVGIEDLNVVLGNWNAGEQPASYVPEPVAAVWLGLYGLMLAGKRPFGRR